MRIKFNMYCDAVVVIYFCKSYISLNNIYRPQTKFAKVMFLQVSVCPHGGGMRGFPGGVGMHGFIRGGMRGFIRGACMVLFGGHAWFYLGVGWACVVLFGGGWACMVLFGGVGHAWFYLGGMHGFSGGGMHGFFSFFGYNEIRSMSGRYASYWNAFLLKLSSQKAEQHEKSNKI